MKCPSCGAVDSTKVIDSRPVEESNSVRRRRECLSCQFRFTTYEVVEEFTTVVVKKNGTKEYFDRNKLLHGILNACHKRPVDADAIALEIEQELHSSLRHEITSEEIGESVMEKLRAVDDVAYVRFASVYKEFSDVETFIKEIRRLKNDKKNEAEAK
jgi:transcriptional repressor NrdR